MTGTSWRFHHVGIATNSIETFTNRINDISTGEIFDFADPKQGIKGRFVEIADMRLEILEPLDGDETLAPWLSVGNRIYQIAFEVDDLDVELELARSKKIRIVRDAQPAMAFDGRRVAFLMPAPGILVELIEGTLN